MIRANKATRPSSACHSADVLTPVERMGSIGTQTITQAQTSMLGEDALRKLRGDLRRVVIPSAQRDADNSRHRLWELQRALMMLDRELSMRQGKNFMMGGKHATVE